MKSSIVGGTQIAKSTGGWPHGIRGNHHFWLSYEKKIRLLALCQNFDKRLIFDTVTWNKGREDCSRFALEGGLNTLR